MDEGKPDKQTALSTSLPFSNDSGVQYKPQLQAGRKKQSYQYKCQLPNEEGHLKRISQELQGKTAIITGATKGIGRDLAISFARTGCNIGITGRSQQVLEDLADEAKKMNVICQTCTADLCSSTDTLNMAEYFAKVFPVIDILVNNAGLPIRVNAIAPAIVLTPLGERVWGDPKKAEPAKARIPLGRFLYPKEVTSAVFFLASESASMIHGETLVIDGGVNANLY